MASIPELGVNVAARFTSGGGFHRGLHKRTDQSVRLCYPEIIRLSTAKSAQSAIFCQLRQLSLRVSHWNSSSPVHFQQGRPWSEPFKIPIPVTCSGPCISTFHQVKEA